MAKCYKCCVKTATYHITDVLSEEQYQEWHLCQECYHKFFYEPQQVAGLKGEAVAGEEGEETNLLNQRECPNCGIKFVEFRNSGRLGCPHDYQEFREELSPLLENIHGELKHCGKTPRRLPQSKQTQSELLHLRKELQAAVVREAYEEAASLRDRIRQLEET